MEAAHRDNLRVAQAAVVVALSLALGNIRLLELPAGGSISFGALPLLAFAVVYGPRSALWPCLVAGAAHALSGGTIVHPAQLLLDYGLAYAALALAGLGRERATLGVAAAVAAAVSLQFACFVISGTIFFGAGAETSAALTYALAYNATTALPELVLAVWLVPAVARAIRRADTDAAGVRPAPYQHPLITPRQAIDTAIPRTDTEAVTPARITAPIDSAHRPTDISRPSTLPQLPKATTRLDNRAPLGLPEWRTPSRTASSA